MSRDLNHNFSSLVTTKTADTIFNSSLVKSSVRYEIINTMRSQVFWRNALGVTATEAPTPQTGKEEGLFVTIEYEFHSGIKLDLREFIDSVHTEENAPVKKELLSKLTSVGSHSFSVNQRMFKYTVGVTREELEANHGVVYLRDLDLVVGFEEYREQALHPYSHAELLNLMKQQVDFNGEGVHQRVFWIDNQSSPEPKWFNNGFGVFQVNPIAVSQYEDGIYLVTQNGKSKKEDIKHLPLDEAVKQFLLFDTKADATAFGEPKKAFESRITEQERELTERKVKLNQQKLDLEEQKAKLDEQKHRLTLEREQQEQNLKFEREAIERTSREEEARLKRLAEEQDLFLKRQQQDFDLEQKRQKDALERQRDHAKAERERMEWERNGYSDRMRFDYDMESRKRKDDSDNVKHLLDMGKATLSLITLGLSIYAVYQKGKKG